MLNVLFISFIGAFVCTAATSGIGLIKYKKEYKQCDQLCVRIGCAIASFVVDLIYLMILFYVSCKEQTFLAAARWIWPILVVDAIIIAVVAYNTYEGLGYELISTIVLAAVSLVICISVNFAPIQNLIYVHDMKDIDISYAVKSDEILAKIELKIDNSRTGREKYSVEDPEMRLVDGKYIAVFHITNNTIDNLEYIPGYAIQEQGKIPEIVSSRIYFDTSFVNERDALRAVRRKYQTEVIGHHKFDIDDEGNPYEVFEYRENLYFSNGEDYGLIILNLRDGTSEKYPVSENQIPEWVDFETTYPR